MAAGASSSGSDWPIVTCDTEGCETKEHWKQMLNKKRVYFKAEYVEDGEDKVTWTRTCWKCVMKSEGLDTEGEARSFIITESPGYQKRKRRAEGHKAGNEKVKEQFPLITNYKELRILTRDEMEGELLSPIFTFLVLKSRQRGEHAIVMEDYAAKVESLKSATSREQVLSCIDAIKECEKLLSSAEQQMSFKAWDQLNKDRFLLACDYSDLMWEVKNSDGIVIAYLSAYYLCMQDWKDQGGVCLSMILSKDWCRFYDDPLKAGQRWHCNCCGVRQRPWMGMLLEIWQKDQFMYAKIPVKDFDTKDLQGLILESNSSEKNLQSPEALYKSLKRQTPNVGNHIRLAEPKDMWHDKSKETIGVYKINCEWYAALPDWSWNDLFVYGNKTPDGYKIKDGKGPRPLAVNEAFRKSVLDA